ncbi:cilia- and flagella-associated protein 36 [Agrilus planipennis]|uniref:Cilia- and flagella-associated protein 36 n=1 Tax=Agrilus planipennis TaxID=224129 RepID=A0A7F5RCQ9_AGRPL|nr:cilia- and flagella-associated protein 36 [Agrilus planipennis]
MGSEDSVWIFDSLVGFLNGPVWQGPIQTFIEENCHAFETHMVHDQSHKKLFEEYRNLVDLMLGSYMDDIGITPQQFEDACNLQHNQGLAQHFDYAVFEQIWAANDFELFKRMMIQRNLEIQLQTLQLMSQNVKDSSENESPETPSVTTSTDKAQPQEGKPKLKQKMKLLPEKIELPPLKLYEEKGMLEDDLFEQASSHEEDKNKDENKIEELENEIKSLTTTTQKNKVSSAEIRKRQEYLRAQRDKLVALKKAERKKKLSNENQEDPKKTGGRPKSARAAESLLTGSDIQEVEQQLKIRKHLAERLRTELINNKE